MFSFPVDFKALSFVLFFGSRTSVCFHQRIAGCASQFCFISSFFSHVGAHQVGYLITEYFLLFWILIFIVESNNPMSLELFSS